MKPPGQHLPGHSKSPQVEPQPPDLPPHWE
jgi:hypothetical protein